MAVKLSMTKPDLTNLVYKDRSGSPVKRFNQTELLYRKDASVTLAPPLLHRYLLYDVNPPEGFNLRRDVYIRMASLVKTLRKDGGDWVLVLPPWGRLYHWQSPNIYQIRIPWGEFFSLTSLQTNVPVIEYEEFIAGQQFNLCPLCSSTSLS